MRKPRKVSAFIGRELHDISRPLTLAFAFVPRSDIRIEGTGESKVNVPHLSAQVSSLAHGAFARPHC
jgi:hypothetical protein